MKTFEHLNILVRGVVCIMIGAYDPPRAMEPSVMWGRREAMTQQDILVSPEEEEAWREKERYIPLWLAAAATKEDHVHDPHREIPDLVWGDDGVPDYTGPETDPSTTAVESNTTPKPQKTKEEEESKEYDRELAIDKPE